MIHGCFIISNAKAQPQRQCWKSASYGLCFTLSLTSKDAGSKGLGLNGVMIFSLHVSEIQSSGQQNTGLRFNILVSNFACRHVPLRDMYLSLQPQKPQSRRWWSSYNSFWISNEVRSLYCNYFSFRSTSITKRIIYVVEDSKVFLKITFAATGVRQLLMFPELLDTNHQCQAGAQNLWS